MNGLSGYAPLAAATFLALCVLWLSWRMVRRLFGSSAAERQEPQLSVLSEPEPVRREPALGPTRVAGPTVPDAADILALKASIDALTKQIGALERRLTPANSNVPQPDNTPHEEAKARLIDALTEVPLIVPDRRR